MGDGHWQLEGNAAELYQRHLVPAITTKWAEDLVERARPRPREAILDIACGTGVVARTAAKRLRDGRVAGLDFNKGMLSVARTVPSEGAPIAWIEGNALDLPFPSDSFDVVFCQLGLQFFPDHERALREMRRVLKTNGRAGLSVYSSIERTPGANVFALALDEVLGANASQTKRSEHAFADASQLETLLRNAGFDVVLVQTVVQTIVFPTVLDYVRFQLLATPMAVLLNNLARLDRQPTIESVAQKTAALSTPEMLEGGRFAFSQESYVAVASSAL
jgi:ubiquinone/menaquinone biosynthesis C-methylase UbiE